MATVSVQTLLQSSLPPGPSGFSGFSGLSGFSGTGGSTELIKATNDTASTALYPVMVDTSGANATPKVTTSKFIFNASTGVLTANGLTVNGNALVTGNLTVDGNLTYLNVETLAVEDPIIQLQTGANGAAPVANSGKDVGTALNYFDTSAKIAFMGWDVSNAEIAFGSNVSIASEVVTFNTLANIRAGNVIVGSGTGGNLTGANLVSANFITGTLTTAAQPNITSIGTLTSLSVSGNANIGNIGTAGLITATGNIGGGNINTAGVVSATGNVSGANIVSSAFTVVSVGTGISAAGSTQGTATALTKEFNVVSTVTSGANGVSLPTAVAGYRITVLNTSANALNVYPLGNGSINGNAANTAYSLVASGKLDFICTAAATAPGGVWYTLNATFG